MTLDELEADFYVDSKYSYPDPPVIDRDRIRGYFNEAVRKALTRESLTELRQGSLPFSLVADQHTYGAPQAFERVDSVVDTANQMPLVLRSLQWLRMQDPGETSFGTPYVVIPVGLISYVNPPSGTSVWAVSTNAADTTQILSAQWVNTDNEIASPTSVALNGTTRVPIATDLRVLLAWSINNTAAGAIELYDAAAAGTLIGRIPRGARNVQYQGYRFWPTPGAAYAVLMDGLFKIQPMRFPADVPMLPDSFHDSILTWARYREAQRDKDRTMAAEYYAEWEKELGEIEFQQNWPDNYRPVSGSGLDLFARWSNVGPFFPGVGWGNP